MKRNNVMPPWRSFRFFVAILLIGPAVTAGAETLRIQGSVVTIQALAPAFSILHEDLGLEFKVLPDAGSTAAISSVGAEIADFGLSVRDLSTEDRAAYPDKRFEQTLIARQNVVLMVPRDVWDAGVRSITKEQAKGVYEGSIADWKALGGESKPIKYYNFERGRGVWEVLMNWIYGDISHAPYPQSSESLRNSDDARNSVEFNAGSISACSPRWIDGKVLFALGIKEADGKVIDPVTENITSGKYPLSRPLYIVTSTKPTGSVKKVIDFFLSDRGREIIKRSEFDPVPASGGQ